MWAYTVFMFFAHLLEILVKTLVTNLVTVAKVMAPAAWFLQDPVGGL